MATKTLNFMDGSGFDASGNAYQANGTPYKPLPQLAQNGQASYAAPVTDPIGQFNLNLMQMLKRAQGANSGNANLMAEGERLQNVNLDSSMAGASEMGIGGLAPGDAMAARRSAADLYNPEVKSLNARMKLNNEAVDKFTATIKAAKEYGEEIQKYIKPSEETVEAVRMQLRSGVLPDKDVLAKIQTSLTEDDWSVFTTAKSSKPSSVQEYEYAKANDGFKGTYTEYQNEDANRKARIARAGAATYGVDKATVAQENRVKQIISINPNEWGHAADQIDRELGAGTATKYDALLKDAYIPKKTKSNPFSR